MILRYIKLAIDTPWKAFDEIKMQTIKPLAYIYARILSGIKLGDSFKFYGLPKIYRHRGSKITIGERFENRNQWHSNPIGINHPTIICTWTKEKK